MSYYQNKKVLVTGGSGLVGTAFVDELLANGAIVRSVAHRRDLPHQGEIEVIQGDLLDEATALKACRGMDMVVHAAGVSGGSRQVTVDPIPMFTDSLRMNTLILEAARKEHVSRFLFISNSSVYAKSGEVLHESAAWGETSRSIPENETGMVKRVGETQCALYARHSDMRIAIMRAANAYGPYDNFDLDASHVIPALIRKAVEKHAPYKVWGDGSTIRDFIHTSDIARAGLFLLSEYAQADPVNIATGVTVSIRQVVEMIAEITGMDKEIIQYQADAPPASPAKRLDIGAMQRLGFQPSMDLRTGLEKTITWFRDHGGEAT